MEGQQGDRCGYTYPVTHEIGDDPYYQNCCFREVLPDENYCVWHIDPNSTSEKTVEKLHDSRTEQGTQTRNNPCTELIDGAILSGLNLKNAISFSNIALRDANFENSDLYGADFTSSIVVNSDFSNAKLEATTFDAAFGVDAEMEGTTLCDASLQDSDFRGATFNNSDLTNATLTGANLQGADFRGANLTGANLAGADLTGAVLTRANLQNADIRDATLRDSDFREANLEGASLWNSDIRDADVKDANLLKAYLRQVNLTNANLKSANLKEVNLRNANLANSTLWHSNLSGSYLRGADLTGANLRRANLTDADLPAANLQEANLERAVLTRTDLFDATLIDIRPYGATFSDVRINDGTRFQPENEPNGPLSWKSSSLRCAYDPRNNRVNDTDEDQMAKAADTYRKFEKLARTNAFPRLQSKMFIRRQDIQRRRYFENGDYLHGGFAVLSRGLFKYGESLGRILTWSLLVILTFGGIYASFGLVEGSSTDSTVNGLIDALYFSTLTFTTLGLGDFQPATTVARALVTIQAAIGAILIAVFVFVLGRRAAR